MEKLAELLNDLLRIWWKPFNRDKTLHIDCYDKCKWLNYKWIHLDGWFMNEESRTLRELVSIDSGLWQFVCENGMIPKECHERVKDISWWEYWPDCKEQINLPTAEYRLIESALKYESELGQFLLDNIKVEW